VPGATGGSRWYPPAGLAEPRLQGYPICPYVVKTERQIPEGTVALEEGAKVIGSDGEHVGNIERIFTDSQENRATHLLIEEGFILKEKKLVPTNWINLVFEDEVHLSVGSEHVDSLPEYQPQA
jgi:hypothetical protein